MASHHVHASTCFAVVPCTHVEDGKEGGVVLKERQDRVLIMKTVATLTFLSAKSFKTRKQA